MQSKSREDTRKTKPGQVSLIFWEINEIGELNVSVFGVFGTVKATISNPIGLQEFLFEISDNSR